MGQIRHYNNGKWTIYTSGENLSNYTGGTPDTIYVGDDEGNSGTYTKVKSDGTKVDLEGGVTPKLYKALLSQNSPIPSQTSGTFTVGQLWTINTFQAGDDFSNMELISGVMNTNGCVFRATTDTPTSWLAGSDLSYDGAPYVVSLDGNGNIGPMVNTLGGIPTFTYPSTQGRYRINLTGAFTTNKVVAFFDKSNAWTIQKTNINQLDVKTYSDYFSTESDNIMYKWGLTIEVYP